MPIRLLTASCAASASAGNCKKVEAGNFTLVVWAANYDDCNTTRNSAGKTVTVGVNLQGAYVCLRRVTTSTTGTFTVALQEQTAPGVWPQKAISAVLNVSSLTNTTQHYYIPFTAPYVATANQFRISINCTTATRLYWWRSTVAGDYAFGIVGDGDDATGITNGDTLLLDQNVVLTVDQSITLAPTNSYSLVIGNGASVVCPAPAAPYTLALGAGAILHASAGDFSVGTTTPPVNANLFTISNSLADASYLFHYPLATSVSGGAEALTTLRLLGTKSADLRLLVDADCAAGQAVVTTVEDIPAAWQDGDTVTLVGKDKTGSADNVNYTITKGAKQVTLNAVLDVKVLAGAALVNLTEATRTLGIKIDSTNNIYLTSYGSTVDHVDVEGAYLSNCMLCAPNTTATSSQEHTLDSILMNFSASAGAKGIYVYSPLKAGGLIRDIHLIDNAGYQNYQPQLNLKSGATISKITMKGHASGSTSYPFGSGAGHDISDVVIWGGASAALYGFNLSGVGHAVQDLTVIGCVAYIGGSNCTLTRYAQKRSSTGGTLFANAIGNRFIDSQ